MNKYTKLGVIFLLTIHVLCGCGSSELKDKDEKKHIGVALQHKIIKTPYTGYFQKQVELSPYEPIDGAYLGAYVLANPELEFDITKFEEAIDKEVAIGIRHYQIGDPFPNQWLLECLANKKAPYIVIMPQNINLPYDKDVLVEMAEQFKNTYGIPVFVEFYPGAKKFGDPTKYIAYFQLAKEIFAHYAPNVVMVWSMDMEDVYDSMIYYPGDDYVDWIGINMYFPIYKNDEKFSANIEQNLDYFYDIYQGKKPMMISKLAISHYSKKDHTFYIDEAKEIISYIYSQIPIRYPRIKGINYIDIDNIKTAPNRIGKDNFMVSNEPKITEIYKRAIKNPYYLSNVKETQKQEVYQWTKMRTPIFEFDNKLHVLEETILYDWEVDIIDAMKESKVIIGGSQYYNLDQVLNAMDYKYTLNKDIIRIYK